MLLGGNFDLKGFVKSNVDEGAGEELRNLTDPVR